MIVFGSSSIYQGIAPQKVLNQEKFPVWSIIPPYIITLIVCYFCAKYVEPYCKDIIISCFIPKTNNKNDLKMESSEELELQSSNYKGNGIVYSPILVDPEKVQVGNTI
jgi:hypothetical protein